MGRGEQNSSCILVVRLLFLFLLVTTIMCVQVQFMKRAVDSLCHCRQTLQFTYAFAFYLKKNNHTLIFEVQYSFFPSSLSLCLSFLKSIKCLSLSLTLLQDNQGDLEMATERLSEYLERELSVSSLTDLKISVQDKTK